MSDLDDQLMALLRALDDPDGLERPRGYDHRSVRARFDRLVQRIETEFGVPCTADRAVQDASLHARMEVPPSGTVGGERIVVCVSNFGDLAVIAAENPGVYLDLDEAVASGALAVDDLRRVEAAAKELGYTLVPESLLDRPYDGVSSLGPEHPLHPPTWWIRYFDYL